MITLRERFTVTKGYNTWAFGLMAVGVISIIILFITHGSSSDPQKQACFWASLLQNSVYFLLITNAVMFFIAATTLAWGGWQLSFRRVSEAVSTAVPVIGIISGLIMLALVFGGNHVIYHWASPEAAHDPIIQQKSPFLNKGFFAFGTILIITLWSFLGYKIRSLSR